MDNLEGKPQNRYYDATYALPEEATKGKATVRVRVQPASHEGRPDRRGGADGEAQGLKRAPRVADIPAPVAPVRSATRFAFPLLRPGDRTARLALRHLLLHPRRLQRAAPGRPRRPRRRLVLPAPEGGKKRGG